jgi:hypothetical protein
MEQRRGPQHDPLAVECRVGLALLRRLLLTAPA